MARKAKDHEAEELNEAFRFTSDTELDAEKAVRAVAFLLEYGSEANNARISGIAAQGLAALLISVASDMAMVRSRR